MTQLLLQSWAFPPIWHRFQLRCYRHRPLRGMTSAIVVVIVTSGSCCKWTQLLQNTNTWCSIDNTYSLHKQQSRQWSSHRHPVERWCRNCIERMSSIQFSKWLVDIASNSKHSSQTNQFTFPSATAIGCQSHVSIRCFTLTSLCSSWVTAHFACCEHLQT